MTQEDRQLLIKDLCTRLPYGVMMGNKTLKETSYRLSGRDIDEAEFDDEFDDLPYLRPMLSMTDEDFQELHNLCPHSAFNKTNVPGWIVGISGSEYGRTSRVDEISNFIEWLNAHYFDYRNLIEKGLALEAPEGMYNFKD